VAALKGPDLLRVKGILYLAGEDSPIAFQAVQDVIHETTCLSRLASRPPVSRLVFITRDIPPERVRELVRLAAQGR
jgi:G3E family GTPase